MAEGIGKVSYANTIATYFVMIAALGIPNYGIKAIAQHNNSIEERSAVFYELFGINFISTSLCVLIYYILVNQVPYFSYRAKIFNVFGSLIILNYFNFDWFYQGIEEYSYIATRSIAIKIVSFALMLLLVHSSSDYIKYAGILCLATAGNYVLNAFNITKHLTRNVSHFNFQRHLKPVFILLASTVAQEIYTMLDTLMLELYHGETYVGYYSNSVKIIRMIYSLTIALLGAFYPRISLYLKEGRINEANILISQGTKIIIVIAIPAVIGVNLTAKLLVPIFFGKSFLQAITTVQILSPLILVFSIAFFLGHTVLMAHGKEGTILKATVLGAISNFCLNAVLIPRYRQNGAAVASVCAEIIVTVVLLIHSKKGFKLLIDWQFYLSTLFASSIMGVYVYVISLWVHEVSIATIFSILGGVLIYILLLFATKNEYAMFLQEKIKALIKKDGI